MESDGVSSRPSGAWTLRKAVTALAISPQTASLTRTARVAFNVLIHHAQNNKPDADGWWSSPMSAIVKTSGSTTRDSLRFRAYIDGMVQTVVRYYPLSASDASTVAHLPHGAPTQQQTIDGLAPAPAPPAGGDGFDGSRTFTLISEARFYKRSGEAWLDFCFPPSIREMLIDPVRWAAIDLLELTSLSRYVAVALYEIVARYKTVPGGLTNRASTEWWMTALSSDAREPRREYRKWKNEALKLAIAEINQRTSLEVRLIEIKRGRAVSELQFQVKRRTESPPPEVADLSLVEHAARVGVAERDLDPLLDRFGIDAVRHALDALDARMQLQLKEKVARPLNYLKRTLENRAMGDMFDRQPDASEAARPRPPSSEGNARPSLAQGDAAEIKRLNQVLDSMAPDALDELAQAAYQRMRAQTEIIAAVQRRWDAKQYSFPLLRKALREALAAREAAGQGASTA